MWLINREKESLKKSEITNLEGRLISLPPQIIPPKGLFTRHDFVACDKLTTGLRHELFRVNQTYNSLTTLKSCRRPVVSLSHATKSCRVNRP